MRLKQRICYDGKLLTFDKKLKLSKETALEYKLEEEKLSPTNKIQINKEAEIHIKECSEENLKFEIQEKNLLKYNNQKFK